ACGGGMRKGWPAARSREAVALPDRFGMTGDVTCLDSFWDPGTQRVRQRARVEHELDRTNTWGLHLQYERPLGASGWRVGWLATGNLMRSEERRVGKECRSRWWPSQ